MKKRNTQSIPLSPVVTPMAYSSLPPELIDEKKFGQIEARALNPILNSDEKRKL